MNEGVGIRCDHGSFTLIRGKVLAAGGSSADAGVWVGVLVGVCGIHFLIVLTSLVKSEASP